MREAVWRVHVFERDRLDEALCGRRGRVRRQPTPGEMHAWEGYCPRCVAVLASMVEDLTVEVQGMSRQQAKVIGLRERRRRDGA